MSTALPKRLIEVDLPIKRISAHARREKSIRHGHISTLHIWWARRPLAACRAVICAALWPDPADENCPDEFRAIAADLMFAWARESAARGSAESAATWTTVRQHPSAFALCNHPTTLRQALLDFIADFANWDNSTVPEYVEVSRVLTAASNWALNLTVPEQSRSLGWPGLERWDASVREWTQAASSHPRPLVVDPFAGGGSLPLEALRVGADAFASDLNPIPVLLNKVLLEYIPKFRQRLADEVRKCGERVKVAAESELRDVYPLDQDGSEPIAFLWARVVRCEGPGCGVELPLIRNLQLTKKGRRWALRLSPGQSQVNIELFEGTSSAPGTVKGGSATCPCCNYTTPAKAVRAQLQANRGGAENPRLLAVFLEARGGRYFRAVTAADVKAFELAKSRLNPADLPDDLINPLRPYANSRGLSAVTRIGITKFGDLYNPRQAHALVVLQRICSEISVDGDAGEFALAVKTLLNFVVSRYVFQNCALSRWHSLRGTIEGAFGKQALQVVWDFAEANPISTGSANWNNALDWVVDVIEANTRLSGTGTAIKAPAQDQVLPDGAAQLIATDPPYFAAIPYADLSNVFFVWKREFLKQYYPDLYRAGLVDQTREIIVTNANKAEGGEVKSPEYFSREMASALRVSRRSLADGGVAIIVFADSSTKSWESILGAIVDAGWTVTSSWPIDTEMQTRTQAQESASLQSSVHIVCRPRMALDSNGKNTATGDWRDVLQELPKRIHEWMPRLASEGVVGADAIFACLGPALEIFSRYSRVEKASGEQVTLREYLEHVWAAVSKEALSSLITDTDLSSLESDARITAMWLWTLNSGAIGGDDVQATDDEDSKEPDDDDEVSTPKSGVQSGFGLEYDAARKIAQGLGAALEDLRSVVEVTGDKARLRPVVERTAYLFGKEQASSPETQAKGRKKKSAQMDLFAELSGAEATEVEAVWEEKTVSKPGVTVLDRVHQSMILFATGRGDALKRFLVEDGIGQEANFWKLAQALSALYPSGSQEKRWVDGVLARKKGLGL
jgi:putative DNA methylase